MSVMPGPACYDPRPVKPSSKKQTFAKAPKVFIDLATPGVGQYKVQEPRKKHSPCARIPTAKKVSSFVDLRETPGPGNYMLRDSLSPRNTQSFNKSQSFSRMPSKLK